MLEVGEKGIVAVIGLDLGLGNQYCSIMQGKTQLSRFMRLCRLIGC